MRKQPEFALFERQPSRRAIIVDNGVYKEVDCYRKGIEPDQYVFYKGGFIKLHGKLHAPNTHGLTSHPKIKWTDVVETPHTF